MVKENLTSSIVHKKNSTKNTFVYFSTTEEIVAQVKDKNSSTCHDYTHMIVDTVVSSQISNDWLKTLENCVNAYVEIGPMFTDLIFKAKGNRDKICKRMGIDGNKVIISFLDHTVGYKGVLTFESYARFINGMLMLAKRNTSIYFLFKSKKDISFLKSIMGEDFSRIIREIEEMPSCVYANEFDLTSFEVIGISDLVVSAPMSSVMFEALCGSVKTISFDPLGEYEHYNQTLNKFPNLNVIGYAELEKMFNYWLYECEDEEFSVFLNGSIKPSFNLDCCKGSTIKRFSKLIA